MRVSTGKAFAAMMAVAVVASGVATVVTSMAVGDGLSLSVAPLSRADIGIDAPSAEAVAAVASGPVRTTSYSPRGLVEQGPELPVDHEITSGCSAGSPESYPVVPVSLPAGAHITEVRALVHHGSESDTSQVWFTAHDPADTDGDNVIGIAVTAIEAGPTGYLDVEIPADHTFDPTSFSYVLEFYTATGGARVCHFEIDWIPPSGDVIHYLSPCKAYDLRPGQGGRGQAMQALEVVSVDLIRASYASQGGEAGGCGVPDDATGVMVVLNVHSATQSGRLQAWPNGESNPGGLVGTFVAGGGAVIPLPLELGTGGVIKVRNASQGTLQFSVTVVGYLLPPA